MTEQPSHSCPCTTAARKVGSIVYLPALFLAAAFLFLPTGSESGFLHTLAIVFVSIVVEAIPFMMIGALVGGLVVNPIAAAATAPAHAFDRRIVMLRLGLGCGLAVVVGMLMGRWFAGSAALKENAAALENGAPSCGLNSARCWSWRTLSPGASCSRP